MAGHFPLFTDENVPGPLIEGLRSRGWDVVRVIDVFGERSVDETVFAFAAEQRRVLATSDTIYWHQGRHQRAAVGSLIGAFEVLASREDAFGAGIEYLGPSS